MQKLVPYGFIGTGRIDMTNGKRLCKLKEAVYEAVYPASVRYHSYCVSSPCAEVSDDVSRLCLNSFCARYRYCV